MMQQRGRFWAVALGLVALAANAGRAADWDSAKVYKQVLPSTVWVIAPQERDSRGIKASTGTGSLIDVKQKYVLTNYHVVGDKRDDIFVFFPIIQSNGKVVTDRKTYVQEGKRIPGRVKCWDQKKDLALIELQEVPPGARRLELAADSPSPGSRLLSIGNAGASGALWLYTPGEVRAVYAKKFRAGGRNGEKGLEIDATIIETTSPTNEGDSGGPLVNGQGKLVGVTQGYDREARAVSLFIDITEVKNFLKENKIRLSAATGPIVPAHTPMTVESKPPDKPAGPANKAEAEAASMLRVAKRLAADGLADKARARYQEVVDKYPNTKAAEEARELLKK